MTVISRKSAPFETFRGYYKPFIRSKGHLTRITRAFELGPEFERRFAQLRAAIHTAELNWAENVILFMVQNKELNHSFDVPDLDQLRRLYAAHEAELREGRFGEAYLDTLEDIALFFIYHEIKSMWVAGAYCRMGDKLLDRLFERAIKDKKLPVQETSKVLSRVVMLEVNQLQRCFTLFERHLTRDAMSMLNPNAATPA